MIIWLAKCIDGGKQRNAKNKDFAAVSYENIRKHLSEFQGSTWSVFQIAFTGINENVVRVWNREMDESWNKKQFRVRVTDSGRLMKVNDAGEELADQPVAAPAASSQTSNEPQAAKEGAES